MKVPFLATPDKALVSNTQGELPIADIISDIVIYKNGGAAIIFESTSLNFELLSELEQNAVIAAYAALLNSITYHIQIMVRSQRKDISSYIKYLEEAQAKITNPKLLSLMQDYKNFILEAIKKKNVLSKKFYIIIPFTPYELGVAKSIIAVTKKEGSLPFTKNYVINKARTILYPKRDHLLRQAGRLSIQLKQLKGTDLINLFYHTFNPEPPPRKQLFEMAPLPKK